MADHRTLGIIGFMLGGIATAVVLVGFVVVKAHVDGRLTLDNPSRPVVSASLVRPIR